MDPNETLWEWACAVLSENRERANEAYSAIRSWIERGGFEPAWSGQHNDRTLPSRKQFFSYDVRSGRIA